MVCVAAACGGASVPPEPPLSGMASGPSACTALAPSSAAPPQKALAVANGKRRVIVVSIDGMRPDSYRKADALGLRIPNLRRFVAEGVSADGMRTVYPSLTYPAHVTMVTGVRPAAHGIYNNFAFDPKAKNKDGWNWYARDIRVPTLWDAAKARGLTVGSVYFPVTAGADIAWNVPQFWRAEVPEDDKLLALLTTPALAKELATEGIPLPGEHTQDRERTDVALHILKKHAPDLLLTYMEDLDTVAHKKGPSSKEARETLEAIDVQLGRLREAAEAEKTPTTWIILSDHGFAEASQRIRIGVALRKAGFVKLDKKGEVESYEAAMWRGNGMCAFYMRDPKDGVTKEKLLGLLQGLAHDPKSGVGRVYYDHDLETRGGFPGAAAAIEARPGYMFNKGFDAPMVSPAEELGAHGYDPASDDMAASLILAGDGIRSSGESLGKVDIVDVAPTIAKLLSLDLPSAEGKPLTKALGNAPAEVK